MDNDDFKKSNDFLIILLFAVLGAIGVIVSGIFGIIIIAAEAVIATAIKRNQLIQQKKKIEELTVEDDEPEVVVKNDIPVPYAVIDGEFNLIGCNEEFYQLMGLKCFKDLNIKEKIPEYNEHLNNQIVSLNDRQYRIYSSHAELTDGSIANSLCFMDVTELTTLRKSLENDKTVVGLIYIDNYDEVIESVDDSVIPMLTAIVDRKLTAMVHDAKGILKKTEKDRYFFCIAAEELTKLNR